MLEGTLQDVRHSLRLFAKNPLLTALATLSLTLGIGANVAIFSFVNALLLKPIPAAHPQDLVRVHATARDGSTFHSFSYLNFLDFRERGQRVLSGLVAETQHGAVVGSGPEAELIVASAVSEDFFDVLGVSAALGSLFTKQTEEVAAARPEVVVSQRYWRNHLHQDRAAIGRTLRLNGHEYSLVGVLPASFQGTVTGLAVSAYLPLRLLEQLNPGTTTLTSRGSNSLELIGRLAPGVSRDEAQAGLAVVASQLAEEYPDINAGRGVDLRPATLLPDQLRSVVAGFMAVLMGVVGVVLLLACSNVATVLLARAADRRREIAVRVSLGASRAHIVRQLLFDCFLLFAAASGLGFLLAQLANGQLLRLELPIPVPIWIDLSPDLRVLLFAAGLAIVTAFAFGLGPALQAARTLPAVDLRSGAPSVTTRSRLRSVFVSVQVALCLLLLVVGGLFLRALGRAAEIEPGFDYENLQLLTFDLSTQGFDRKRARDFYPRFLERVRALPSIESAALADFYPLALGNQTSAIQVDGFEPPPGLPGFVVDYMMVTPGYADTLGLALLAGRDFGAGDSQEAPPVVVINQALAERFWPGTKAVGQRLEMWPKGSVEVVGVVSNANVRRLGEAPRPHLYIPFEQSYRDDAMTLHFRPRGDAEAAVADIRRQLQAMDPDVAIQAVHSMEDAIGLNLLPQRLAGALSASFGIVGVLLASLGVYGMTAYTVTRRRRELAIRQALGADRVSVLRYVGRSGLSPVAYGLAIGVVLALFLGQTLSGYLYGVSTFDWPSFTGGAVILAVAGLLAIILPTRRALGLDLTRSLRNDS